MHNVDGKYFRFIPAGAGNTYAPQFFGVSTAVYPRWRGEHEAKLAEAKVDNGLSPLARGTLVDEPNLATNRRFIPAGAGNTQ